MTAIHKALNECSAEYPVFYEDEVDIHLNPKIGADWQLRGQQKRVVTPGHCIVAQEKSATRAAVVKVQRYSSVC